MNITLTIDERRHLLQWARQSIEQAAPVTVRPAELTPVLEKPYAAFVTLKKCGELRGCIGQMDYERPLYQNCVAAAIAAARADPRFPPVTADEVPELHLEISILEPPQPIGTPAEFDPNRQGIIVERGGHRALLLPQVARENGWDATQTLATVCWKAGLPAEAWREPATQLSVFEALVFGEEN